ncbi:MAG: hypothetical protein M3371_08465, partial [Acidobacteriota bacterium]|nr:hypothetical protein [Acidobacteriota bacterium]
MRFPLALCLLLAFCLAPDTPGQPAVAAKPTEATAATPAKDSAATAAPKKSGSPTLPPEKAQPVRIPRFDSAPVIDGKLDDAVWKSAAVFKDFYQIE